MELVNSVSEKGTMHIIQVFTRGTKRASAPSPPLWRGDVRVGGQWVGEGGGGGGKCKVHNYIMQLKTYRQNVGLVHGKVAGIQIMLRIHLHLKPGNSSCKGACFTTLFLRGVQVLFPFKFSANPAPHIPYVNVLQYNRCLYGMLVRKNATDAML